MQGKRGNAAATFQCSLHIGNPEQHKERTSSINKNERVYLIEYGAGFFAERNADEAIGFYTRKIKLIR